MLPNYQEALNGTLKSDQQVAVKEYVPTIQNNFPFMVNFIRVLPDGLTRLLGTYPPGGTKDTVVGRWESENFYIIVQCSATGGFVGVIYIDSTIASQAEPTIYVTTELLGQPNDIGALPASSPTCLIPTNTPDIIIGIGYLTNGNFITRSQAWIKNANSVSVAPGETKTYSYAVSHGLMDSSSSVETISSSISSSASESAGFAWDSVSVSISASLSKSSTHMQSHTVTELTTRYDSDTITNNGDHPITVFKWQMRESITIFDKYDSVAGSYSQFIAPELIGL
jgi:hypothetical protein